jgi:hypothetical protein
MLTRKIPKESDMALQQSDCWLQTTQDLRRIDHTRCLQVARRLKVFQMVLHLYHDLLAMVQFGGRFHRYGPHQCLLGNSHLQCRCMGSLLGLHLPNLCHHPYNSSTGFQ